MSGKILVSPQHSEDVSLGGIVISTSQKVGTDEHVVMNSGVPYLNDGDVVVCEAPSKTWTPDGTSYKVGITDATNALLRREESGWRPLRNDLLVKLRKSADIGSSLIITKEAPDESVLQFFDVIDTGDDCKEIRAGDVVVLPWLRVTPPFTLKGYESFGVTCEDEVVAIVEE